MALDYAHPPTWHIIEDCGAQCLARILGWDGTLADQSTVSAIAYKVFDEDANKLETGSGDLVVSAVIFNAAQTGHGWPYDDGFNFKYLLPASCFPTGGHRYRAEFLVTPVSGERYPIGPYYFYVHALLSS